jgi:hypothetical protein
MQVFDQDVLLGLLAAAILACVVLYARKNGSRRIKTAHRMNRALDLWMSIAEGERRGQACAEKRNSRGTQVPIWSSR